MTKREKIQIHKLLILEAEFQELLIPCLQKCARGRWGLFGAYDRIKEDNPNLGRFLTWPEADRLRELAITIQTIRADSGERNDCCDEFLRLCALHRPNDPGEPKIAREFLDRIGKNQRQT
jgi:hypothetical protein